MRLDSFFLLRSDVLVYLSTDMPSLATWKPTGQVPHHHIEKQWECSSRLSLSFEFTPTHTIIGPWTA